MRLGLQNIVWGKTEIFRTTDQWNPQDLALSSLPTLEESRHRAVVGARECTRCTTWVRSRMCASSWRANLDKFEPADLARAASPYAPTRCARSRTRSRRTPISVSDRGRRPAGEPVEGSRDLEIGGRIEWRWDRFTFALTISGDTATSRTRRDLLLRPRRRSDDGTSRDRAVPGQALGTCARGGQVVPDPVNKPSATSPGIAYSTRSRRIPIRSPPRRSPTRSRAQEPTPCPRDRRSTAAPRVRGGYSAATRLPASGRQPRLRQSLLARARGAGRASNALQFQSFFF
jgi:hypothetical protein